MPEQPAERQDNRQGDWGMLEGVSSWCNLLCIESVATRPWALRFARVCYDPCLWPPVSLPAVWAWGASRRARLVQDTQPDPEREKPHHPGEINDQCSQPFHRRCLL